jgi:hypothetical protein
VRQHLGVQALDRPRPLAAPLGVQAMLDTGLEQHLHPDADAEHRAPGREPLRDQLVPAHGPHPGHARGEGPHAGHGQPVRVERRVRVRRYQDIGSGPGQSPFG